MTYNATVRMTSLAIFTVLGAVLSGCAGPQVQMTVVAPPRPGRPQIKKHSYGRV